MNNSYSRMNSRGEVSTRLIVALAVIGVLVVAAVPLGFYVWPSIMKTFEGPPPRVAVVKTVKELKALKPFLLPGGQKVRIGISSEVSYIGGVIYLYCLTDWNNSYKLDKSTSNPLGPVSFEVWPGIEMWDTPRFRQPEENERRDADDRFFFASIYTPKKGSYIVEFFDEKENMIAEFTISAWRGCPHPWQSIDFRGGSGQYSYIISNTPDDMAALPINGDGKLGSTIPETLPILPLDEEEFETGNLTLKPEGNSFIIEKHMGLTGGPSTYFLGRFKVNDKPVIPKYTDRSMYYGRGGLIRSTRKLTFDFDLDYKALGAKKGDTVSVQLLYGPHWYFAELHNFRQLIHTSDYGKISISNVLKFKVE